MDDETSENYEVVFCAPGEALGAKDPQWFLEGCYSQYEDAHRAAQGLIASTNAQLNVVSILHAQFDAERAAFRERVVWSGDRGVALLSRLNLQPLEAEARRSIIAHCDARARSAEAQRPVIEVPELQGPSPVLVGLTGTLTAACCALGVFVVLS
jgi:hypothetical protein